MRPFAYERAADAAGAVALLECAPAGARYLAGGTNLVDLMKLEVETPELLVDVRGLGTAIEETAGGGRGGRARALVREGLHARLPATSVIASTMLE